MPAFTTTLLKFGDKGEKTGGATLGWTYIDVPLAVTEVLKPGRKTSFRVKGLLDNYPVERIALVPMGESGSTAGLEGQFIMAINAAMRRALRKEAGAVIRVELEVDESTVPSSADLLACLADEPRALAFFQTLSKGHQTYFSQWIESAKTGEIKAKRILQAVTGLAIGLGYGEMIRYFKQRAS